MIPSCECATKSDLGDDSICTIVEDCSKDCQKKSHKAFCNSIAKQKDRETLPDSGKELTIYTVSNTRLSTQLEHNIESRFLHLDCRIVLLHFVGGRKEDEDTSSNYSTCMNRFFARKKHLGIGSDATRSPPTVAIVVVHLPTPRARTGAVCWLVQRDFQEERING
jgi:hypothetical protein